ncbi:EFR1 family ferrodoxin [Lachnospiraceae bacterium ZAX-1]
MKILYFTSTGNCLYVAKKLGGKLLSIPQLQKDNTFDIADDVVGIVTPIYGFDVPRPVRQYLDKVTIRAKYVFAVMTYGDKSMAAVPLMEKLLHRRGVTLNYSTEIKMVDNYLPGYEASSQLKMKSDAAIDKVIDAVVRDIKEQKNSLLTKNVLKQFVSRCFSAIFVSDMSQKMMNSSAEKFTANDNCTACGVCRKVCPMGNIIGNGKPEYLDKCEFCLACIHLCPQNAIHLNGEKSAARFKNSHIELSEIIVANCQLSIKV